MSPKPIFIVSDVHLGAVPASTEASFRRFLAKVGDEASALVINGDLFDFWFEYRTVIVSEHYRVLAALRDVVEAGVKIWFVGGNHDAWGGPFLQETIGLELLDGPAELDLDGRRTLVVHGDGVGGGDSAYRAFRRLIRNRVVVRAFRFLHPDLGARIADRVSTTEGKAGSPGNASTERAERIVEWAREQLQEREDLDLVVAGHVHLPAVEELAPGKYYLNAGDWINHNSYIVLPVKSGAPELRFWSE